MGLEKENDDLMIYFFGQLIFHLVSKGANI
jgi:hypothetical protein